MTRTISKSVAIVLSGLSIFAGAAPAKADIDRVVPTGLEVQLGQVLSGNVRSLAAIDLDALIVRQFIVPNRFSDRIAFTVAGHTHNTDPVGLSFTTMAEQLQPGAFNQLIDLYDFNASDWVTTYEGLMTLVYSPAEGRATGDLRRFVTPMGMVIARVRVRQVGPGSTLLPSFAWEMGNWIIVQ